MIFGKQVRSSTAPKYSLDSSLLLGHTCPAVRARSHPLYAGRCQYTSFGSSHCYKEHTLDTWLKGAAVFGSTSAACFYSWRTFKRTLGCRFDQVAVWFYDGSVREDGGQGPWSQSKCWWTARACVLDQLCFILESDCSDSSLSTYWRSK